jgi:tetratricopeptide (TPR) repeat protein
MRNSSVPLLLSSVLAFSVSAFFPLSLVEAHEAFVQTDEAPVAPLSPESHRLSSIAPNAEFLQEDVLELLRLANEATAAQDFQRARQIYEQLILVQPELGLSRMARFFKLINSPEVNTFGDSLLNREDVPLVARAKALIALRKPLLAVKILEDAAAKNPLTLEESLSLSTAYRRLNRFAESDSLIISLLPQATSTDRAVLADHFFTRLGEPIPTEMQLLIPALDLGYSQLSTSLSKNREFLDAMLFSIQHGDSYFSFRSQLIESRPNLGPVSLHLLYRLYLQEGLFDDAETLLASAELDPVAHPYHTLLLQEYIDYLVQSSRGEQADALRHLLPNDGDRPIGNRWETFVRMVIEGDFDRAREAYPTPEEISANSSVPFLRALIIYAANQDDIPSTIRFYHRLPSNTTRAQRVELHEKIFSHLTDTVQHLMIEQSIRELFTFDSAKRIELGFEGGHVNPILWLLASEAALQTRLKPNEFEAWYQYVQARPDDLEELQALATQAQAIAVELHAAPEEDLLQFQIPILERQRFYNLAEQALQQLIRSQPYAPEPLQLLIQLYTGTEQPDKARAVPQLIAADTTNIRLLKNAGLVLSLEGYPEDALTYYDKAISLAPGQPDIRTNRAAALTRLGRWDEAIAEYKDILEHGFQGISWHGHEYVLRLYSTAETLGTIPEMEEYFEKVARDTSIPWRLEICDNLAALYLKLGNLNAAENYARLILEETTDPELRLKVWEKLIAEARQSQSERVESYLVEALEDLKSHPKELGILTLSKARQLSDSGETEQALSMLLNFATTQTTAEAYEAYFYAALICQQDGDTELARSYYQRYLETPSVNFLLRRTAEKELTAVPE